MIKKTTILLSLICSILFLSGCNNDDESTSEPETETFLCCGTNPFESSNIDNLDQSTLGIIEPIEIFTPNQDGFNDTFRINNLGNYPNSLVTIFDLDDNVVSEYPGTQSGFDGINQNDNSLLPFGSYRYKIVVENENTFLMNGYVCFIREGSQADGMSFNDCLEDGSFDPIII
ncbi:gliding motility-associated C-terminal domain-containing protein [uncultured Aquimarina sp.]|uniref:T9SS type B sorting domain-containing protein n=1 Tax=uncultured Aquimarina sp. TaxID=575652 RepID=UPI002607572E|nr:gliding motility-associated C-terminal domain-containing protein [uncultured Aquimarina sp.]